MKPNTPCGLIQIFLSTIRLTFTSKWNKSLFYLSVSIGHKLFVFRGSILFVFSLSVGSEPKSNPRERENWHIIVRRVRRHIRKQQIKRGTRRLSARCIFDANRECLDVGDLSRTQIFTASLMSLSARSAFRSHPPPSREKTNVFAV